VKTYPLLGFWSALFSHLRARWQDLFAAKFDVLLYDLTSTYFESPPPDDETDKRRHGYSRDKRSDCVQVVGRPPTPRSELFWNGTSNARSTRSSRRPHSSPRPISTAAPRT
jgi:hypothetical protein